MATTINNLINTVGLKPEQLKTVKWGCLADTCSIGIYIVSTSARPDENFNLYDQTPIDDNILRCWLKKVRSLQLDGRENPTVEELKQRLSGFWFRDENIIYIGQTENRRGLRYRVNQYYRTELGNRRPHAGGHWIKTLKILNQLFVHYVPDDQPKKTEAKLLCNFASQVSEATEKNLFDSNLPIPFANLEIDKRNRKHHGISKSRL